MFDRFSCYVDDVDTGTAIHQGLFVKFIQQETGTRVQIKGMGSGFIETETGRESEDPMHVHVT